MKKYYFKYISLNNKINKECLWFGEEHEIIEKLENGENIKNIFETMFLKEVKRVKLMFSCNDSINLVIDSKDNKYKNSLKSVA